jgi:hypothetical protein
MADTRFVQDACNAIGWASCRGVITAETLLIALRRDAELPNEIPADVVASAVARRYDLLAVWLQKVSS